MRPLLVSVSVHFGIGLSNLGLGRSDQRPVAGQSLDQRDLEPILVPIPSSLVSVATFEIGCMALVSVPELSFGLKLIKITILSIENHIKLYFEGILNVTLYFHIGVASTSNIPPSVKGKGKIL